MRFLDNHATNMCDRVTKLSPGHLRLSARKSVAALSHMFFMHIIRTFSVKYGSFFHGVFVSYNKISNARHLIAHTV